MSDKSCGEKSDRPNQYSPAMQSQSGLIKEVKTEIEDVAPDIIQGGTDEGPRTTVVQDTNVSPSIEEC
ncbi:hypothetical protein KY285_034067 [Solanum tuberosum]|uniref:Class VII unconventional myosin n=1 Tax=Solanum tuberosum TaxID=4113 RepID=M1AWC2_SOLTU|nr:hypothetical protein KY285_034067 [Solanum tuberosum]